MVLGINDVEKILSVISDNIDFFNNDYNYSKI